MPARTLPCKLRMIALSLVGFFLWANNRREDVRFPFLSASFMLRPRRAITIHCLRCEDLRACRGSQFLGNLSRISGLALDKKTNKKVTPMNMKTRLMTMTAVAAAMLAAPAFAQSPAGSPADPNSVQNRQPGPSAGTPTDPAAGASPSARVPTSPSGTNPTASEGMSTGESGGVTSPSGIPADPNSMENRQPGPSATTPTDPAAGSKPGARVPTAP